jgi:hypothetical protein
MSAMTGHLLAYFEQGWEGMIAYAFQPDDAERPVFLQSGQRLSIFAADGTTLWAGRLHFVRRRWWDQHNLSAGIWADVKQKGVSYEQWMEWFWRQPPLRAALELQTS